jgi:hypothetical protein
VERACFAIATSVLGTLLTVPALAYHDEDQRITDESAYTLRRNDFRVGIWKLEYGVIDSVTAGTYIWPWLFRVSNAHAKWRFWQNERVAFSAFTGFFRFDTERLESLDEHIGNATITVVPFELAGSYRFDDRYTLTIAPVWTTVDVEGELGAEDLRGAGQGAASNFQLTATLEWRLSRVTALLFHFRQLVVQRASASGGAVFRPDEFTTVEVYASGRTDAINFRGARSLTVSSVFSWEIFNLRTGLSFGNYNVPGVNFVLGTRTVVPELDLYWIF